MTFIIIILLIVFILFNLYNPENIFNTKKEHFKEKSNNDKEKSNKNEKTSNETFVQLASTNDSSNVENEPVENSVVNEENTNNNVSSKPKSLNEKFVNQDGIYSMKYERCCKQYGCNTPICQHILRKRQSKNQNLKETDINSDRNSNFNVVSGVVGSVEAEDEGDFTLCYGDNEIPKYNELMEDNAMSSLIPSQFYYPEIDLLEYEKLGYITNNYVNNGKKYDLYGINDENNQINYVITDGKKIMWNFTRNKYNDGDHLYLHKSNRQSGPYFVNLV